MSTIESKPVVIRSTTNKPGSRYEWSKMGDFIKEFTNCIEAQAISTDRPSSKSAASISQAVSGLPSPFARASMFTYALMSSTDDVKKSGLMSFYSTLLDEWKGMIACFALSKTSDIRVKRINLFYTNGDGDINSTDNIYEPKGAFGNMLLNRKQLWCDQDKIDDKTNVFKPFIDIIYYNNHVIGAASPESLIFTAPKYSIEEGPVYVNSLKRFTDPLNAKGRLDANQLNTLIVYITKLKNSLPNFFNKYQKSSHLLPNGLSEKIAQHLNVWLNQMEEFATANNFPKGDITPEILCFELEPFKSLFNYRKVLYAAFDGTIYADGDNFTGEVIEFKGDDLLLDEASTTLCFIEGDLDSLKDCPIHLLKADSQQGIKFFTIPLCELGLKVFENSMIKLVSGHTDRNSSSLSATYDTKENILAVTLELRKRDGSLLQKIYKNYKCHSEAIGAEKVIIWPNFISKLWNKYYLFSEMPHNATGWQSFPILGDLDDKFSVLNKSHGLILNSHGQRLELPENDGFIKIATNGKVINPNLGRLLISNIEKTTSQYKYEIYESSRPFKGVELKYQNRAAGFIFINYDSDLVKNKIFDPGVPSPTRVGIDFGSNNACIAFYDHDNETPSLLKLSNRRISLFSSDNIDNSVQVAQASEMLFFQNDEPLSNKIKSVLTIHDESRIVKENATDEINILLGEIGKGGFMCYETNIAIEDSSINRHSLNLPKLGNATMVHNMKWSLDSKEEAYKKAFLKAILLQTYAELFDFPNRSYFPNQLVWAYPSSMSAGLITTYNTNIWSKLIEVNPLQGGNFALSIAEGTKIVSLKPSGGLLQNMGGGLNPMGGGLNPMGGGLNPMGGGLNPMGGGLNPMGGGLNPMGGGLNPMGGGLNPMGGGLNPMGGGLNPMGGGAGQIALLPLELPSDIDPNSNQSSLKLEIENAPDFKACTEAMAVSNYVIIPKNGGVSHHTSAGNFVLGFDVGGSTTDILAMTTVGQSPTLIKQNSIKIAAGYIADATKIAPGFKELLKNFVQQQKLGNIYGINYPANIDRLNPNTMPFYYNQVIDRLETKDQLDSFYKEIGSKCKPLMWLNLYMTGLTMFYAGMIARKLRTLTENNLDLFYVPLCGVTIDFFGKGSRIFDWFKANDETNAYNYLLACFSKGYGAEAQQHFSNFVIANFLQNRNFSSETIKIEVAFGLASERGIAEAKSKISEIVGEDGYTIRIPGQQQPIALTSLMDNNPSLMQRIGAEFLPPMAGQSMYPRFTSFIEIFYQYAVQCFEFNMSGQELLAGITAMNIVTEVKNDEGYKQGMASKTGFDFVAPLFILQGQAFLKSTLMPKIQRG